MPLFLVLWTTNNQQQILNLIFTAEDAEGDAGEDGHICYSPFAILFMPSFKCTTLKLISSPRDFLLNLR